MVNNAYYVKTRRFSFLISTETDNLHCYLFKRFMASNLLTVMCEIVMSNECHNVRYNFFIHVMIDVITWTKKSYLTFMSSYR